MAEVVVSPDEPQSSQNINKRKDEETDIEEPSKKLKIDVPTDYALRVALSNRLDKVLRCPVCLDLPDNQVFQVG